MASKGKGIASGGSSGGKRKYGDGDDKSGGGRKRSNPSGVLRFFEDSAAEADDGDESDFDDFMEEEFETQPIVQNEPGKAHNLPFIPKEEDLDGDEFEKMMEERYRSGSSYVTYAEDNYENKRSIDGSVPLPTLKDPSMWKVKCMVGRERYSAFCMMQKFVDLRSLGTRLQIISAFAVEHIKGFIFIEADKQSDINEACKGICSIYSSRVMPVPNTEVSHLLSPRTRKNEVTVGMWARVKNGNYKGDLAQVVFVNDLRKRATVKLIPRIDLQALAAKFGGGATRKKMPAPAPRLISSNELEEFRPLIQYRLDRESGLRCEFLDGLMFKDGYLYKKVSIDSLSFWGILPSKEELLKFKPSEKNKNDNLEWLSDLYGKEKKRRIIKSEGGKGEGSSGSMGKREGASGSMGKGDVASGSMGKRDASGSMGKGDGASGSMGKGDGASGSMGKGDGASGSMEKGDGASESMWKGEASENGFLLYDLVCFGRKDFGLVIGMEKDDSYKILKEGPQGSVVVPVQKRELKNVLSDMKFTALDQRMKPICVSDTVKVLEGPLEGRQGIVKQIYRGTIFLYDENETENGGYFCSKSHMCEKIKLCIDDCKEKDGDSGAFGFEDFMSSPKSPLSPKKPWQERESNFNRGDTDAMFAIGQTVRIRVGPLKGYLCRVLAIRRSDITVKLDSQQKVLTVKCEHLTEVRGKSSNMLISEDPESSSLKPFDLLGTEGGSRDWTDGAGASAGGDGWNPFSQDGNDVKKDDTSWESKVAPNKSSSWGAAAAAAADNNDQGAGWGKSVDSWDKSSAKSGGDSSASDIWQKAIEPAGTATAGKSELDSWGKGKNVVQAWEKNCGTTTGDVASSGWGKQSSWEKGNAVSGDGPAWGKPQIKGAGGGAKEDPCSEAAGNWSNKEKTSLGDAGWKSSLPAADAQTGSWGNAGGARAQPEAGNKDEASGWTQSKGGSSDENQKDSWKKPSSVVDNKRDSWVKEDGGSAWNNQGGSSTRDKQDGGSAWNKPAGDSSWSKQTGGSSWGKQADVKSNGSGGQKGWGAEKENVESGDKQNNSWGSSQVARVELSCGGNDGGKWNKGSATDEEPLTGCDRSGIWNAPKSSDKDQSSGWGHTTAWKAGSTDGGKNQDSNWGQKGNWKSGPSETGGNQDSNWGKKSDWNSQSSETGGNQDSSWGKKTNWNSGSDGSCGNQDANWGKKSNWNTESNDTGGNKDSGWGKKNSWNSGSGDADQNSNWSSKSNWNSSSFGDNQERDGGNGDKTEDFNNNPSGGNWRGGSGRGNSDRGGFRGGRGFGGRGGDRGGFGGRDGDRGSFGGRGRSDRGGFSSRGGSDGGGFGGRRGGFGGRDGDRGSFGGRGRSDRGGFGGRGGSDGGFGGRGRGRRDESGGWSDRNDSVDNNSTGWSKGGDGSGEGWKNDNGGGSWSQGDGSKNNWQGGNSKGVGNFNSSDWSSQGSAWNQSPVAKGIGGSESGWNQTVEAKDTTGSRDKGSWGNNWKSSDASAQDQLSSWKQSTTDQEVGWNKGPSSSAQGWGNQGSGWNKGTGSGFGGGTGDRPSAASGAKSSGWNPSGEAKQGTDEGAKPTNSWGKGAAASSWATGDGGSGKGGGTGNLPSAAVGGQSSGWKQSSAQSSGWNQSGEAKQGTDGVAEPANAWGKAAASSWGKGDGGSGKGGW